MGGTQGHRAILDALAGWNCMHPGYEVDEWLGATTGSRLGRGRRLGDSDPSNERSLFLKLPHGPASPEDVALLRREFELSLALAHCPGVLRPVAFEPHGLEPLLGLEGKPGESLEVTLTSPVPKARALGLALRLAQLVAFLHEARVIHRDLCPRNLLVDSADDMWFLDLSRARRWDELEATPDAGAVPTGELAYISPEQTGRLNRTVDVRSDLYSLGVILYRLFGGELPFNASDVLQWVHAHLARTPPPLEDATLSAIVLRLLAKPPEDRYQSARGLALDLERCLEEWDARGKLTPFSPGQNDVPARFQAPRKLYGRETSLETLFEAYERAKHGDAGLALVAGYSGVGKSSLVQALRRRIPVGSAFFITGKFDPLRGDIPYSTLVAAFRELVYEVLAGSEEQVAAFRRRFADALGTNGRLITDVVPEVELVIGPQPKVPELPPTESQNRFRIAFASFVSAITQEGRPLVLFLDDLQWADAASLELVCALLVDGAVQHLLVLGAYRDNEVGDVHPLHALLDQLASAGVAVSRLNLGPFDRAALAAITADGLHHPVDQCTALADLVHGKTAGNPFFAIQFLTELCDERLIAFDAADGRFRWDLTKIRTQKVADNVAELMLAKLQRLPRRTQRVLETLASIGSCAEVSLLAVIEGGTEAEVNATVQEACQVGLLARTDGGYAFVHDRVREAAYTLIREEERAAVHLEIARRWTSGVSWAAVEEHIFDLVGQWNRGADLVTDPDERATMSRLNALAGTKAKAAVAYASARIYLTRASEYLPPDAWDTQYEQSLALTLELGECEYSVGAYARAEEVLDLALSRARSSFDAARVDRLRVRLYQLAARPPDAVAAMLDGLARFGITFPGSDAELEAASTAELAKIADLLSRRSIADIVEANAATDPGVRAAIRLLDEGLAPAYTARPALWQVAALRITSLSLEHGHAEGSAFGYIAYAVALAAMTGDRETSFAFSEMSLQLNERQDTRATLEGKLLFHHAAMVHHWCRPYADSLRLLDEAFPACLAVGELVYAGYMTYNRVWLLVESGAGLARISEAARDDLAFAARWHNELVHQVVRAEVQFTACLQGTTPAPPSFDDASFSEAECLTALERAGFIVGQAFFHVMKQMAAVVYGRFAEARASATRAAAVVRAATGLPPEAAHHFYLALTLAALHDEASEAERPAIAHELVAELARHERWAEHGPENFGHRRALIAAELARIEVRDLDAERGYDDAVRLAREHGFVHAEAIAWEAAARFHRSRGRSSIASACLREARAAYARWGAAGKVAELDRTFPGLGTPAPEGPRSENLDLLAAIKASQAISRQIELGDLLDVLMRVVLEAAGAQTAWLLLSRDQRLSLAAKAIVDERGVSVESTDDGSLPPELPLSILNYARRSCERVLLDDAAAPGPFAADPVLASGRSKSVLCLPILHQSELIALLYLENQLVTGAFSSDRVAVLELLAVQAAISLENARLYADVRRENTERRQVEGALRESQALLQAIVNHAPALIYVKGLDGRYLLVNHQLTETLGREPEAILGKTDYELFPGEVADAYRAVDESVAGGAVVETEEAGHDSARVYLAVKAPLRDAAGRVYATCGIATDITERKRADAALRRTEEQLRQSQKMEAIGNLAGGVAHDFNNLLSVILSYGMLLARDMNHGDPRRSDVEEIVGAANRAAELTRQLLAFGRKQILQPRVVDLNDCVGRLETMLRRLIGEDVELAFLLSPELGAALVDPGQIEQILMNLAVNSRDAMPEGGKLTIETANVELDGPYAAEHLSVRAGPHVVLAVSDTGVGMDEATQSRMFEPFFTTKELGKGTGLGLATVFGIVRQSGGHIWVYSEAGAGTTIKVYFPRVRAVPGAVPTPPALSETSGGTETILLVEDDERVRTLARTILRRLGYHVLEAQGGGDALLICEQHPAAIHLLLTDVIMPRMSGKQLADRLQPLRPSMRVLYMSGYTDNSIVHHGVLDSDVAFLEKPLTPEKLARKVRQVLDDEA